MIPVILIHKGLQDYIQCTLKQANKYNFVYLIGDTKPTFNLENFEYVELGRYSDTYSDFSAIYTHMSTTPYDYELFCFNRWFILSLDANAILIGRVKTTDKDSYYNTYTAYNEITTCEYYHNNSKLNELFHKYNYSIINIDNNYFLKKNNDVKL